MQAHTLERPQTGQMPEDVSLSAGKITACLGSVKTGRTVAWRRGMVTVDSVLMKTQNFWVQEFSNLSHSN